MSTSPDGPVPPQLPASSQPAVRLDAAWLRRGGEVPVLRGVSFALAPGSFHVLIGPPGSGKSSLLRLIGLSEPPSQGLVQVFGRDASTLDPGERAAMRRRIGVVLDPPVFIDHLSAWDNAALGPRLAGRKPAAYGGEVDEVLAWLGLARRADILPAALAEPERQRLALARAVVGAPEILLVDTPAGGGAAPAEMTWLFKRLDEFHRTGAAVVVAAGDPGLAAGRPALRLEDGRVTLVEPAAAP